MTTGPCDVQITTGSAAGMLAAWASIRARTNGCAATVREITSSRNVRNPAQRRRMWHASYIPAGKAMAGTPQPAQFGNPKLHFAVLPPWAPAASPSSTGRGAREVPRQAPPSWRSDHHSRRVRQTSRGPPVAGAHFSGARTFFKPLFLVTSALWCAHARPGPPAAGQQSSRVAKKPNGTAVAAAITRVCCDRDQPSTGRSKPRRAPPVPVR